MSLKIVHLKYDKINYTWPEDKIISGSFELDWEWKSYSIHTIHITHGIEIKLWNQLIDSISSQILLDAYNNNTTGNFNIYNFSFPIHIPNKQEDNYTITNFFRIDIDIKFNIFDSKEIFYPNIVSSLLPLNDTIFQENLLEQLFSNQNIIEKYKHDIFFQIPYLIHTTAKNIWITGLIKKVHWKINIFELSLIYFFIIFIIPILMIQIFPFLNVYKIGSFFIMFWMFILPFLFFIFWFKMNTLINNIFLIDFQEIETIRNHISGWTLDINNIINNIKINYWWIYKCKFDIYLNYVLNITYGSSKTKTSKSFILWSIKIWEYSWNDLSIENITNIHENDWNKYWLDEIKTYQTFTYYEIEYTFISNEIFNAKNILKLK